MAILLHEEGLYERSRIYATDINDVVLQQAKAGIFPLNRMQEYTENYIRAGGKQSFSEYYTAKYDGALFSPSLTRNIVFSQHNLEVYAFALPLHAGVWLGLIRSERRKVGRSG